MLRKVELPRDIFDEVLLDPTVREALDNLDIDPNDHKRLEDILDPDRDGTIQVVDLITGLMRLRGQARRSDIVCVDLMIRSLHKTVSKIDKGVESLQHLLLPGIENIVA